jgi:hypothetical protein
VSINTGGVTKTGMQQTQEQHKQGSVSVGPGAEPAFGMHVSECMLQAAMPCLCVPARDSHELIIAQCWHNPHHRGVGSVTCEEGMSYRVQPNSLGSKFTSTMQQPQCSIQQCMAACKC